jgi:hypothetical protein
MLYVIIREGPNPEESRPVFISSDPRLTRAIGELVAERLGGALRRLPSQERAEGDGPTPRGRRD